MPNIQVEDPPTPSPPRARHSRRRGPTRFEKESAATGGKAAADQPGDPKVIGPWRIGRTIGKGASGRVKIAKHTWTGQYAAIKIVPKHALLLSSRMSIVDAGNKQDKAVLGIEREIVIMKLIDHPNVMALYDVWETAKELYLVLEYVEGGELFDYLVSQGRLQPDEASRYFQQIVAGVDYCHRFNICHRDLKPENLLLDCDKNIKIADFGMAALEPSDKLLETSCGSPHYASPEIVAGMSYHGAASDIWSCGVILFALLTGRLPFDDENIRVLLQKVKNGRYIMPADLPPDAKDLITRMLVMDPEKRISMAEIAQHPFCQRKQDTDSGRRLNVVEPPRLDQISRPVSSEKDIDRDILRNLRTLWSGSSERAIIRALLSREKTWEKAFYFLLLQYRNKHLENFNPDTEQSRQSSGDVISEIDPNGPAERLTRKPTRNDAKDRQSISVKDRNIPSTPHQATRPAPRSPGTPRVIGPRPPSPRPGSKPATAKLDAAAAVNVRNSVVSAAEAALPRIMLQRPTPEPEEGRISVQGKAKGLGFSIPTPSPTPSPSTPSPTSAQAGPLSGSPVLPGQNPLGNINVPHVQDAALQKFFHDIAEQLQLIGSTSPRSSIVVDNLPSPALSSGETTTPSTPLATPLPFEVPTMPRSVDSRPKRPGYTRASTDKGVASPRPDSLVTTKRRSYLGDASNRENVLSSGTTGSNGQRRSVVLNEKTASTSTSSRSRMDVKRKSKPPPLDLTNSPKAAQAEYMLSPTSSPYLGTPSTSSGPPSPLMVGPSTEMKQSWFTNLFSWKPAVFTLLSADDCASSRAECIKLLESFGASVKVENAEGWGVLKCRVDEIRDVTGIIIPKPIRFRIEFLPHATWPNTIGSVTSQTSTVSASAASTSVSGSNRRVGVGVEVTRVPSNTVSGAAGETTTSITMIQEKGALSSFKAVHSRIRAEWRLDSLRSPAVPSSSRFVTSPLASPALSADHAQAVWG